MSRLADDAPTLRLQTLRRELARRPPPVALPTSTSLSLLRTLLSSMIGGSVALVDDEGRLEGTLVLGDLEGAGRDATTRDVMVAPELVMQPEDDPASARAALVESDSDRVVVVTASGTLLGVLLGGDLGVLVR